MINKDMEQLGKKRSAIRELFEQGKILKEQHGNDNVFDFSLGNPSVPCPKIVNDSIIHLVTIAELMDKSKDIVNYSQTISPFNDKSSYKYMNSTELHGYTSAQGDKVVRDSIAKYLYKTYNANVNSDLIYMTTGAAAALIISLKALTSGKNEDEVIVFSPYFPLPQLSWLVPYSFLH